VDNYKTQQGVRITPTSSNGLPWVRQVISPNQTAGAKVGKGCMPFGGLGWGSHNQKKMQRHKQNNKSILTTNGRQLLMSEQPKRRINHTLAAVRISMEVLRLGPDVEPLPHERLGP